MVFALVRFLFRWTLRIAFLVIVLVALFRWVNPPTNYYQVTEYIRLGSLERDWRPLESLPIAVADSAVAAEDANFCRHRCFDLEAIRSVLEAGESRGASTITQQVAKNVFLWHGRSWVRKGLEAGFSLLIELLWGKPRILEVYLNVAEFDEGVFGIGAASERYFGKDAEALTSAEAARLMTVLPNPKGRSAVNLRAVQERRLPTIRSGAETVAQDDRGACYRP